MAYKRNSPQPIVEGGTGVITLTSHGILMGNVTGAIQITAEPTDGQLLIGKTGNFPVLASLAAGAGISVTPGSGTITIANTSPGVPSIVTLNGDTGSATGTTVTLDANTNCGSTVKFTGAAATVSLGVSDIVGNTIIGQGSGNLTGAGGTNTVVGYDSLVHFTGGNSNAGLGKGVMHKITSGYNNTAIGSGALSNATTGYSNTVIGMSAGQGLTVDDHYNIAIGTANVSVAGDIGVIRIGETAAQSNCYIGGIQTVNVGSVATVVSHSGDHLGSTTITAGAGISVTPGANSITIANTAMATPFTWAITTVNASLVINNGYIANKAGLLTMTLPATGAIGDIIEITNMNTAVGWRIAQNANQYIRCGALLTTVGIAGYLESLALGDSAKLLCIVAGASTGWQCVTGTIGNLTVI